MKNKSIIKKPNTVILLSITIIVFSIFAIVLLEIGNEIKASEILAIATAIIGIVTLGHEMRRGKNLSEAEFIVTLNQVYTENQHFKKAYNLFDNYDFENCPDLTLTTSDISNYLTFFETFHLLGSRGVLEVKMIDNLFGHRFFIAIHNPYVQKVKLIKEPENFVNLFKLERKWMDYRVANNKNVFGANYSLEKQYMRRYGNLDGYWKIIDQKNWYK